MDVRRGLLMTAAVALLLCPTANAQPQIEDDTLDQVEKLAASARQAYKEKRYDAAIAYYLRAYKLEPAGALLYNIAFIYDKKLSERDLAMEFYRRYIRAVDAEADVVERAINRLAELKTVTKKRPVIVDDPGPDPNRPVVTRGAMHPREIAGWSVLGGGALLLAGAATLSALAARSEGQALDTSNPNLSDRQADRDTGKQQAIAADVMWGVGGAALIAGLVLALTAPDSADSAGVDIQLGAAPLIGGGGLVLLGGSL